MADAMSGTAGGMMGFLDYTGEKGLLTKENAQRIKGASREVFQQVEGDDWEAKDVRDLDLEDLSRRFEMLRATKYTPASLKSYKSRLRTGVAMYLEFLADPGGWRPRASSRPATSSPRRKAVAAVAPGEQTVEAPAPPRDDAPASTEMMTYPFPLRRDGGVVFARLILPHDLSPKEAERIGDHIKTLAVDDQLALPRPPHPDAG